LLQVVHLSDLHLFLPTASLQRAIQDLQNKLQQSWAAKIPGIRSLTHTYSYAFQTAQRELPNSLRRAIPDEPTVLAITGDIAALPYDSAQDIDNEYYSYVCSLVVASRAKLLLTLLGNHDWDLAGSTPFQATKFETNLKITSMPRPEYFPGSNVTVIFFVIPTTNNIFPAVGDVKSTTIGFLKRSFEEGRKGQLKFNDGKVFTEGEYRAAFKVVLMHHFPLPHSAYGGRISWLQYCDLRLRNRSELLRTCQDEIDTFMFGHSHEPCVNQRNGFIMVDAGSTLATDSAYAPRDAEFQMIQLHDTDKVNVLSYRWDRTLARFDITSNAPFRRSKARRWWLVPKP